LTKLLKTPHHTRASIRVKFPDGYILQGTFGALEKVKDVVEFVKSNLMHPTRKFYVFESPPRRVLNEKLFEQNLIQAKLVPSSLLYFAWTDLPETKNEHGPFMDMKRLREFIYTPPQKSLKEENKKDNDGDEIMS
jgi:UBX domain-containing protein 6